MCQQFPKYFFPSEVWQVFGLHKQGIFDKILLKFSKEKTLAGTAMNGTN